MLASEGTDGLAMRRVHRAAEQALDLPAAARRRFLVERLGGRAALLAEAESLLAADAAAGGFLERPVVAAWLPAPAGGDRPGPESEVSPGRVLGRYRLGRLLGRGGTSSVYLAVAAGRGTAPVALKVGLPALASPELQRRFELEARLLARLDHPGVVRLVDSGCADGLPFLAVEYVAGVPIHEHCDGLAPARRLAVFVALCAAAEAVHRRGIVHGDLKPGNVLVTPAGEPKLLDFGIAAEIEPPRAASVGANATRRAAGTGPLTPEYAGPERLRGEPATPASDVYALGVVLHLILTGRLPRRLRVTVAEGRGRRQAQTGSARRRASRTSHRRLGGLDRIIATALAADPARRPPSAAALAAEIHPLLAGTAAEPPMFT